MSLNEQQIADDEGETVGDAYDRLMEGVELDTDDEFDEGLDDEAEELDRDEKGRFKAKAGDKDEGDDEPEAEEEEGAAPMMIRVFPFAVGALELCAAVVYLSHRKYLLAIVWACYAVSAAILGWIA